MASVDSGPSEYAGHTQTGVGGAPAGAITFPSQSSCTLAGAAASSNSATTLDTDGGATAIGIGTATFSQGISVAATVYKNTGYYVTGTAYETWTTVSAPASSSINPITGHTLSNVTHEALV